MTSWGYGREQRRAHRTVGDLASSAAAQNFASSNSTMHTFLGGKPKAWMNAVPSNVSPVLARPPSKARLPSSNSKHSIIEANTADLATKAADISPVEPPSNSTSPHLANSFGPIKSTTAAQADSVLPSPAPSEGNSPKESHTVALDDDETEDEGPHDYQRYHSRWGQELPIQVSPSTPVTDARAAEAPRTSSISKESKITETMKRPIGQALPEQDAKRTRLAHTSQMSKVLIMGVEQPRQQTTQATTRQQFSSTTKAAPLSIKPYAKLLDNYVRSRGGSEKLEPTLERPRFDLLRDACMNEDIFYVALHQVFCLHALVPAICSQTTGFGTQEGFGFTLVAQLIRDNTFLSPESLEWLANFPSRLSDLLSRSTFYQDTVSKVGVFLRNLPQAYNKLQKSCHLSDMPPIVHHMITCLQLPSETLQRVVFTAMRRNLWGNDDVIWSSQFEAIFRDNQIYHRSVLKRMNTARPPPPTEIEGYNQGLIKRLRDLRQRQLSSLQPLQQQIVSRQDPNRHTQLQVQTSSPISTPRIGSQSSNDNAQGILSPINQSAGYVAYPAQHVTALQVDQLNSEQNEYRRPNTPISQSRSKTNSRKSSAKQTPAALNPNRIDSQQSQLNSPRLNSSPFMNSPYLLGSPSASPRDNNPHIQVTQIAPMRVQQVQGGSTQQSHSFASAMPSLSMQVLPVQSLRLSTAASPFLPDPETISMNHQPQFTLDAGSRPYVQYEPAGRQGSRSRKPLIPPVTPRPSVQAHPNSAYCALHQAHLRSPLLRPSILTMKREDPLSLFRYVREIVTPFTRLPEELGIRTAEFTITPESLAKIPPVLPVRHISELPIREVVDGSTMYRLRCVKVMASDSLDEKFYVLRDTAWPKVSHFRVNGKDTELRLKAQHGKDLPLDITPYVHTGSNVITAHVSMSPLSNGAFYVFAVEAIGFITRQKISEMATMVNAVPARQTLDSIKSSLTPSLDDDEITIVNPQLRLALTDPMTMQIFNTPVRGSTCRHRECFDLDTFLSTRRPKPNRQYEPCMIDEWKCPICLGDVRPQELQLDGWFADVRQTLEEKGLMRTRVIVVKEDGSWEPEPGEDDNSMKRRESEIMEEKGLPKERVVIDLEDD
ncbi:MAG: hypothetical protein M1824_005805 [Vezdaea acicularis]|nr:MAG: hypothetical protein M1824_005805 [Vezdaea acicularis]